MIKHRARRTRGAQAENDRRRRARERDGAHDLGGEAVKR